MKQDIKTLQGNDLNAIKELMNKKGMSSTALNIVSLYNSLVLMELDRLWDNEEEAQDKIREQNRFVTRYDLSKLGK